MSGLIKELEYDTRIAIGGHVHPDGDCVGSAVACAKYLQNAFPDKIITVFLEKPAKEFSYLLKNITFRTSCLEEEVFDSFICLDSESDRLGFSENLFRKAKKTINVDHHITNKGSADFNIIMPKASSTAEVLYGEFEKRNMNAEVAEALYIGIIHDTGIFQYSNTSKKTMQIGADLISYGFDFSEIIENTFYKRTLLQTKVMAHVVSEAKVYLEGKFIIGMISKTDMDKFSVTTADFDGIVNQLRNVEGIMCAAFAYEKEEKTWKVSLRSTDQIDSSQICAKHNGGGHKKAAGCMIYGTKEELLEVLKKDLLLQMKAEETLIG